MKSWIRRVVLLAVVAGLALLAWRWLHPDDESLIRTRLSRLAGDVSFARGEGSFAKLSYADKVVGHFTREVEITLGGQVPELAGIHGRDQLRELALGARAQAQQVKVQFLDVKPAVDPGGLEATAVLTVLADVNGEKNAVAQELEMTLSKTTGEWLIRRVEAVKTLRR